MKTNYRLRRLLIRIVQSVHSAAPIKTQRLRRPSFGSVEIESNGIDTIALAGRVGAIVENVTEMSSALPTDDLRPLHSEAVIGPQLDISLFNDVVETRPSTSRLEFGVGVEQRRLANDAHVRSILRMIPVFSGECLLRSRFLRDVVRLLR